MILDMPVAEPAAVVSVAAAQGAAGALLIGVLGQFSKNFGNPLASTVGDSEA